MTTPRPTHRRLNSLNLAPPTPPTPLLSPSKAALASQNAADWSLVLTWLDRILTPSANNAELNKVLDFERNDETLAALLEIMRANGEGMGLADAVMDAEAGELKSYIREEEERKVRDEIAEEEGGIVADEILDATIEALDAWGGLETTNPSSTVQTGEEALATLSETAIHLGIPTTPSSEHNTTALKSLDRALLLHKTLQSQTALLLPNTSTPNPTTTTLQHSTNQLQSQTTTLRNSPCYSTPPNLQQNVTDWTRQSKILSTKISEYESRLARLNAQRTRQTSTGQTAFPDLPPTTPYLETLIAEEKETQSQLSKLRALENEVSQYRDLPDDIGAAKEELKRQEDELRRLVRRRDDLFEGLVEVCSPGGGGDARFRRL